MFMNVTEKGLIPPCGPAPVDAAATPSARLQSALDRFIGGQTRTLKVLEAGCGSLSNIRLGDDVHIVGIDVSARALAQNTTIHERVLANLETVDLGASVYDLIVCWDVLEHLPEPVRVLSKFFAAVKPGGLILLAFPNVLSLKGLVTKYTPLAVHLFAHRLVYGARAGTAPGYELGPTYLRYSIAPRSIVMLATRHGFEIDLFCIYESGMQRRFREQVHLVGKPWWWMITALVRLLSGGAIDAHGSDCLLLLRWPSSSTVPRTNPPLSRGADSVLSA